MISAAEALKLPSAQLEDKVREKVDLLEKIVEKAIHEHMQYRGINLEIKEIDGNVISALNQRLLDAGFTPQWEPMTRPHALFKQRLEHVGFNLALAPSREAYLEARKLSLS